MKLDIFLLFDIWTDFENQGIENFDIQPCYFYSFAGLALQAALKKSKINFGFTQDKNTHNMMEIAICGVMTNVDKNILLIIKIWQSYMILKKKIIRFTQNKNIYNMMEIAIRGVMTNFDKKYTANNKYMGKLYDPKKENHFVIYLDANNIRKRRKKYNLILIF